MPVPDNIRKSLEVLAVDFIYQYVLEKGLPAALKYLDRLYDDFKDSKYFTSAINLILGTPLTAREFCDRMITVSEECFPAADNEFCNTAEGWIDKNCDGIADKDQCFNEIGEVVPCPE